MTDQQKALERLWELYQEKNEHLERFLEPVPESYRDYALTNSRNYKDMRECHIEPDWLLVYKVYRETLILILIRTGSHSDLF